MDAEELCDFTDRLDRAGYRAEVHFYFTKLPKVKIRKQLSRKPTRLIPRFNKRASA